jgi:hypothetical protein
LLSRNFIHVIAAQNDSEKSFLYQRGGRPQGKVGVLRIGVTASGFGLLQLGFGIEHLSAIL